MVERFAYEMIYDSCPSNSIHLLLYSRGVSHVYGHSTWLGRYGKKCYELYGGINFTSHRAVLDCAAEYDYLIDDDNDDNDMN